MQDAQRKMFPLKLNRLGSDAVYVHSGCELLYFPEEQKIF